MPKINPKTNGFREKYQINQKKDLIDQIGSNRNWHKNEILTKILPATKSLQLKTEIERDHRD